MEDSWNWSGAPPSWGGDLYQPSELLAMSCEGRRGVGIVACHDDGERSAAQCSECCVGDELRVSGGGRGVFLTYHDGWR